MALGICIDLPVSSFFNVSLALSLSDENILQNTTRRVRTMGAIPSGTIQVSDTCSDVHILQH